MKYFLIYLPTKEVYVQAENKGAATSAAIEQGRLDKWALFDGDLEIIEIQEWEYKKSFGPKRD